MFAGLACGGERQRRRGFVRAFRSGHRSRRGAGSAPPPSRPRSRARDRRLPGVVGRRSLEPDRSRRRTLAGGRYALVARCRRLRGLLTGVHGDGATPALASRWFALSDLRHSATRTRPERDHPRVARRPSGGVRVRLPSDPSPRCQLVGGSLGRSGVQLDHDAGVGDVRSVHRDGRVMDHDRGRLVPRRRARRARHVGANTATTPAASGGTRASPTGYDHAVPASKAANNASSNVSPG